MEELQTSNPTDSQIIVRNSLILVVRHMALWGLGGVLILFLPRHLGDQGLGQLQFALSFVSLAAVGVALGSRQFLIKEIARDANQIQTYLSTAIGLRLLMAVLVFVSIVLATNLIGYSWEVKQVIYLAALWMILTSFAHLMMGVLHGLENMSWPGLADVISKVVVVIAAVVVLTQGLKVTAYLYVLVAGAVVHLALNAGYVGRRFPLRVSLHLPRVKALLVGGAPFLLIGFLMSIYNHVDVVMLKSFTTDSVVGWYAAANRLYHSLDFLPIVLGTAMLPTLARVHAHGGQALDSIAIAKKGISTGIIVIFPLALLIALSSEEIIDILPYPDAFQNSAPLLTILALSMPISALLMILGSVSAALDRQRVWSLAFLATVLTNVGLNAVFIPYFQEAHGNGGLGAAISTLICESLMIGLNIWLLPKTIFDKALNLTLLKVGISGGAMVLVGLLAREWGLGLAPFVALAVFTYASLVLATRAVNLRELMTMRDALVQKLTPLNKEASL